MDSCRFAVDFALMWYYFVMLIVDFCWLCIISVDSVELVLVCVGVVMSSVIEREKERGRFILILLWFVSIYIYLILIHIDFI